MPNIACHAPSPRLRPHRRSVSVLHSCDITQLSSSSSRHRHPSASAGNRKGRSAAGVHGVLHMLNQPPSRVVKKPRTTTPPPLLLCCAIASTAYMILVNCTATALPCAPLPSPNLLVPLVPARTSRCCILPLAVVRCVAILAAALAGGCSERYESAASARQGKPSRVRGVGAHRQPN